MVCERRFCIRVPGSGCFYRAKDHPRAEETLKDFCRPFPPRVPLEKAPSTNKRKRKSSEISSQDDVAEIVLEERDFSGSSYVPVYVMLPLGIINTECELMVDPCDLLLQLRTLNSVKVDGVVVETWWGIVEANSPKQYNWEGYKRLFSILRESGLRLQVVMSFHEAGGYAGDDFRIPLPKWIEEIGRENPDIYFTDKDGKRNHGTLTWGIDNEPVLRGRTAVQVYEEYMRSFRVEFDEFFRDGSITRIEIGLGACGVLCYPSYPAKHGWPHPGIGEFQCYDKYLKKCLEKAAEASGHPLWGRPPNNAGSYNSQPQATKFFCDGGDYDNPYGRFFLKWYSEHLIDHGDKVLAMANYAFDEGAPVSVKFSGMHWWHKTDSYAAAEQTAGFYNRGDGLAPIASMLKRHAATLNFTCPALDQQEGSLEAMVDSIWKVLNAAWDADIPFSCENALPCYDRKGYNQVLELAKPRNDRYGRHLYAFTYHRLNQALLEQHNLREFQLFVNRMHGEAVDDPSKAGSKRAGPKSHY